MAPRHGNGDTAVNGVVYSPSPRSLPLRSTGSRGTPSRSLWAIEGEVEYVKVRNGE